MKKLTRLLLINWHYFQNQMIDFGTINFLTGKNSAGKSTIIDALQIVLLGEIRSSAFNRAASKKSERTLKSYLIGSLGEDIQSGIRSLREGKDFSSYIVAEFFDDMKETYFCTGAVFDSYADGGDITKRFFWIRSRIPEHRFILSGKTMDSRATTKWFKEKYPNRYETRDTAEGYKKLLLQRFNVHEEKFFTMMKKAISFEPINDIERFITENICDVEDNIDIHAMQENILYYRQQEQIAQKFEEKLVALLEIHRQYEEFEKLRTRRMLQRFLIDYGTWQDIGVQLEAAFAETEKYDADITESNEKYQKLQQQKEDLEAQRDQLVDEEKTYRANSRIDILEQKKKELTKQIQDTNQKIEQFVYNTRTRAARWCAWIETCIYVVEAETSDELLQSLGRMLKRLERCKPDDLNGLSVGWFTGVREGYRSVCDQIRPILETLQRDYHDQQELMTDLRRQIDGLKRGLKSYPAKAVRLKAAISEGLRQKYQQEIEVSFLADVMDVTDEAWHNAVEGYLNTQRMNIIVPPQYFMDAYEIYKSIQFREKIHGFAVVDLERVHAHHPKVMEGSLFEVVKTEDPYVRSYLAYLLGRVIRCEQDSELRDHPVSVTKDCMLYSGFSVKAMDQNAYLTPYIGQDAIQKQILSKTEQLKAAQAEAAAAKTRISGMSPLIEKEWFLTEDYIASTVTDIFGQHHNLPELKGQLGEIIHKIDQIDMFWLHDMEKKIEDVKNQIDAADQEILKTYRSIGDLERERQETAEKRIPSLKHAKQNAAILLAEQYTEQFTTAQGIPRYEQELARCGSAAAVSEAFASPLKQTETLLGQAEHKLIDLRGKYNTEQHTSFALADTSSNKEFEAEYQKIADYELPQYRERIEKAKQDAMEQFKNDFLYRLRSNIGHAYEKIAELNAALKRVQFGNDSYKFEIKPNPAYREYYDMIMSDLLEYGTSGIFGAEFTQRYQTTIDNLFAQILSLSEDDTGKTAQNVEMFSQYKTYLTFDLLSTDSSGRTDKLSKSIFTKSGGETQTPFYIAVLASFAQLYRISDTSDYGNTLRIVIFDEAFNKMDDERIIESVRLLRKFELQAIVCTPPDKAADLQPISDKTLLVHKEQTGKGYHSTVIEWSKELGD